MERVHGSGWGVVLVAILLAAAAAFILLNSAESAYGTELEEANVANEINEIEEAANWILLGVLVVVILCGVLLIFSSQSRFSRTFDRLWGICQHPPNEDEEG